MKPEGVSKISNFPSLQTKVMIGEEIIASLPKLLDLLSFSLDEIFLVSDEKIWQKNQQFFIGKNELGEIDEAQVKMDEGELNKEKLNSAKSAEEFFDQFAKTLILKDPKAEEQFCKKIIEAAQLNDSKKPRAILGFGSGTINDLCKYAAFKMGIPYFVIPSAASMNGYLSSTASIKIDGHKQSIPAKPPIAVICDLKIIANSPISMTRAGIADLLCFWSCWFDWWLAHRIFGDEFCHESFEILVNHMNFLLQNFSQFSLQNPDFLKFLMETLLLSGQAMAIAKSSKPASESEHLIAHYLEMRFRKETKDLLHGELIAITTPTSLALQNQLLVIFKKFLKGDQSEFFKALRQNFMDEAANDVNFLELEPQVVLSCNEEFQAKANSALKKLDLLENKLSEALKKADESQENKNQQFKIWLEEICEELIKISISSEKLNEIFQHFGIDFSIKKLGISEVQFQKAVVKARFIRNRITCLDVLTTKLNESLSLIE